MADKMVGGASKEIFDVLADITAKTGNGTFTLDELKRFAKRENPFSPARLSKKQREEWEKFYRDKFGMSVDLSGVKVPDNPGGFDRILIVAQGLSIGTIIAILRRKYFKVWVYREDLDDFVAKNERTPANGHYAIRVRERIEADEELKNLSAEDIMARAFATMTLLERLLYELKYFRETGKHLDDVVNWTLCSGSRAADGSVPDVCWDSNFDRLGIDWCCSWHASGGLRARAVVS